MLKQLRIIFPGLALLMFGTAHADKLDLNAMSPAQLTAYKAKNRALARANAPQLLSQIVLQMRSGSDPSLLISSLGLTLIRDMKGVPDAYLVGASSVGAATQAISVLKRHPAVSNAFQDQIAKIKKFQFVPNDPEFAPGNSTGSSGQWHLRNTFNGGADVNVAGAWIQNITGTGVVIGIVDDSFETTHPDLAPGFSASDSFDFADNDNDPNPDGPGENHGIAVAGVAGARGGNGIGVTGAAPRAILAGLKIGFTSTFSSQVFNATLFNSTGEDRTIDFKNHSYGYNNNFANDFAKDAFNESADAGLINVAAAGNSRDFSDEDSNKKGFQNAYGTITVSALDISNVFSPYSSFGANVFVTAPSSGNTIGITTTDHTGANGYNGLPDQNYTSDFGGTSSASPLALGVLALLKEKIPALDHRYARHLLARFSDIVNPADSTLSSDGGWKTNAAGFRFNQNYGFGRINAGRLIEAADLFEGISDLTTESTAVLTPNVSIPDNSPTGATTQFTISSSTPLEQLVVKLGITHTYRGDLSGFLTSPSGTTSRLFLQAGGDGAPNVDWEFISNAFWGENPAGTWTLKIVDNFSIDTGTIDRLEVTARMGELISLERAAFVSQEVVTPMEVGSTQVASITFQNIGISNWTRAEGFRLRYAGGGSPWGVSSGEILLPETASVAPGQSYTFTFPIVAPGSPGQLRFQYQMFKGSVGLPDAGPAVTIRVVRANRAAFVSQVVPTTMLPDRQYRVSLTFRNNGSTTWLKNSYVLAFNNPELANTWGTTRTRIILPGNQNVPAGQSYTFTFNIKTPFVPGAYNFQWRMFDEASVAFFGEASPNRSIAISAQSFAAQFESAVVPSVWRARVAQTVTVTMKNVGNTTWTNAGGFGLLYTGTVLMTPRFIPLNDGETIAPGRSKTFTFLIAPARAGSGSVKWTMVRNTSFQFNQSTPTYSIMVAP